MPAPLVVFTEDELKSLIAETAHNAAVAAAKLVSAKVGVRPLHVTMSQAAEMVGLSQPTIKKMVNSGTFKLNSFGLIPIEQVDAALQSRK